MEKPFKVKNKKRMKIFFPLHAFYPSQVGGPCNTLNWHCSALKNKNIDTVIITSSRGIEKGEVPFDDWVNLESGDVFYGTKGNSSFDTLKKVSNKISETDIIHLNSLFSTLAIYTFFYRSFFYPKKKIIWSVRGELNENALKISSWKKRPLLYLYKLLNKNIVYHSTSIQETKGIQKMFPQNKIVEIPNFIAPSKRLNLKTHNNLLFVGRIHPIKAIHKLIEATALSKKFMDSKYKLFLAGIHEPRHQYYMAELESLIEERKLTDKVQFLGHIGGDEKEKAYAEAVVLILPSETENFGNVVIEALNQGTPVIASKGTPWSILEKFNCGYHVENSPSELAKAIDEILSLNNEEYEELRVNSKKLVDENYNIDTQIVQWIEVYSNLLKVQ